MGITNFAKYRKKENKAAWELPCFAALSERKLRIRLIKIKYRREEMNRKKPLSIMLIMVTLLLLLTGCHTQKSIIGDPPVSMKTVTQNSNEGLATFEFLLPKGGLLALNII
ncbi:MAG: hypothetical protein LKJ17_04895 [Oscillospiraceae bacterium]|jgi:hypothetical protein|nr:hypothetical protein [Oscillospiraceae bacterium]